MGAQRSLLMWKEETDIAALQEERCSLQARLAVLRPHAHQRIELTARLKVLTEHQLRLELKLAEQDQ